VDNLTVYREADGATFPRFAPHRFSRLAKLDLASFIDGNRSFLGDGEALGYLKPLFKAEFLRQHALQYNSELRIGEDYMLLCEALANGAYCGVVSTAGYIYTVREGSISHRLSLADLECIAVADKRFITHYKLRPMELSAQKRREYRLNEAFVFTRLVDAIKRHDVRGAVMAMKECPLAVRHLWRPVWARMYRFRKSAKSPDSHHA
jgi:succinoglycan biosynthesis protein ExoO